MSGKICECGHPKSQHSNIMWDKLNKSKRTYQKWVGNEEACVQGVTVGNSEKRFLEVSYAYMHTLNVHTRTL